MNVANRARGSLTWAMDFATAGRSPGTTRMPRASQPACPSRPGGGRVLRAVCQAIGSRCWTGRPRPAASGSPGPRLPVGIAFEQAAESLVEVGGGVDQPVAQVLELGLLEQEVLADAGVEGLDGVDGEVVAGLDSGVRGFEFGVLGGQGGAALNLDGGDGAQADQADEERGGGAGDGGAVACEPAVEGAGPGFGVGVDRLIGQPAFDVVGEVACGGVACGLVEGHGLADDGVERRVDGGVELARRRETAGLHIAEEGEELGALERRLADEQGVKRCAEAVDVGAWAEGGEVAAIEQVIGEGAILVERPGLERGDELGLVKEAVLESEEAEEEVLIGGHGVSLRKDGGGCPGPRDEEVQIAA